jgi:hypothetical protein
VLQTRTDKTIPPSFWKDGTPLEVSRLIRVSPDEAKSPVSFFAWMTFQRWIISLRPILPLRPSKGFCLKEARGLDKRLKRCLDFQNIFRLF